MTDQILKGADFVARRRLSNAADETLAAVGEFCDRVPASSLPGLLQSGKIERATRPAAARTDEGEAQS